MTTAASIDSTVPVLAFSGLSDDAVKKALQEYQIGLTVDEARTITKLLGRDPTVVEAVVWGIQGSEHCSYKSSRRFLKQFTTSGTHIILGPVEDSGIVAITDEPAGQRWGLAITHESHNHPSQIVPFEGAATGIGGTVRDVVCMGARVIGCMDMLRLGDLKSAESRNIAKEVIRGIGGYGNPLGVPNLGGDTVFDSSYNSNCLVNAIALGIVREDEIIHSEVPDEAGDVGYDIILVGKPTDRSGFGGASFASASMEEDKREQNSGAVQEPNPFLERHLLASCYSLFDWLVATDNLKRVSCKDLGAGGVVCASVEQVADKGFGAVVDLDKVHTALDGLPSEVIACAETQERLCFTCHPDLTEHILSHFNDTWDLPQVATNARASLIGKVQSSPRFTLTHQGKVVCDALSKDITSGLQYERPIEPIEFKGAEPDMSLQDNVVSVSGQSYSLKDVAMAMIGHINGCSRRTATKHFDKNVIGNTQVEAGEADAAVIMPLQDLSCYVHDGEHPGWDSLPESARWSGVALAADGNGRYGRISPYWQGANAAVESMRNVVATGATPRALTDCLNYGNPELPRQLWQLAEGVRGIAEAGKSILFDGEPVPVISGNVSLYNGRPDGSAIDPTAVVSCTGVMPDARQAVSMSVATAGLSLILIGERQDECGGSLYYDVLEQLTGSQKDVLLGANVPQPDWKTAQDEMTVVLQAARKGLLSACHDISDGGILMAVFEMLLPQRKVNHQVGATISLDNCGQLEADRLLFSQTGGFIIACTPENEAEILSLAQTAGIYARPIGTTTTDTSLHFTHGGNTVLTMSVTEAADQWNTALDAYLTPKTDKHS